MGQSMYAQPSKADYGILTVKDNKGQICGAFERCRQIHAQYSYISYIHKPQALQMQWMHAVGCPCEPDRQCNKMANEII